ncbi:hypothetical protein E2C01_032557 [Portunus trituberculatus]|uniref:Uncharacterized protein n=1 Tax=Portunus trituberculatus TaxID=210409 RepID=A0A5B7F191_PORTR|nr:hypothetical protein [Portunus trituberculatus]
MTPKLAVKVLPQPHTNRATRARYRVRPMHNFNLRMRRAVEPLETLTSGNKERKKKNIKQFR